MRQEYPFAACGPDQKCPAHKFGNDKDRLDILSLSEIPESKAAIFSEPLKGHCRCLDQPLLFRSTGCVSSPPWPTQAHEEEQRTSYPNCVWYSIMRSQHHASLHFKDPNSDYFMIFATVVRKSADFGLLTLCFT